MESKRDFSITVLGRTLEHLGVQMYKRRDAALSELVANSWDAGATTVHITVPTEGTYDQETSLITVRDNGCGMTPDQIQDEYLVIGRNRRNIDQGVSEGRHIIGRKGIGKLAGFGIAKQMQVTTWNSKISTTFELDIRDLKVKGGLSKEVTIQGRLGVTIPNEHGDKGTIVQLKNLKHKTPLNIENMAESLARRFSRSIRGKMTIYINGKALQDPTINFEMRYPEHEEFFTETLESGLVIKYNYGFSENVIHNHELRGFAVYVRGKTAQAPPFYFNVEATASGQHGTKYLSGNIEADFLDADSSDESDLISTDRQEIDWADERVTELKSWGTALTRRVLIEWAERKGNKLKDWILENPDISKRISGLDSKSQTEVTKFLKVLGKADPDSGRVLDLADSLVRAYEYRNFHDVVTEIEAVSDDPDQLEILLTHLYDWKVLESRAILEIIKGRLKIIDTFESMLINDAPETAHRVGDKNMHDLIAGYPWLLKQEWQLLTEEKSISTQLRAWSVEDIGEEASNLRYDFLALEVPSQLVVIEIKRSEHPVSLDELQRLEKYKEKLSSARPNVKGILIYGGKVDVRDSTLKEWQKREDIKFYTWSEIIENTKRDYAHYKDVLQSDVAKPGFLSRQNEVIQTRRVIESGTTYRGKEERQKGLGPDNPK